ncbi:MAG: ATPase component BioM of energizing module of biotin ECF transporter [uncultured Sulfurovum sp.]|uniref:ATPase component BioM of energizing module of biotin ECF transporter n=1 Tax=uncultured Sulfurovum sp. TaxID=269237 RepID=A0A6S6T4K2_9BACT|nr:MAG: ATPase component BioM of energizing module of biotin ECF transporter [uncultured Sulfurovum sp.]
MQRLITLSNLYFSLPTPKFKRYLFTQIDFKSKLIGILGQRGVGKTTLIRQIAQHYELDNAKMLYISADNVKKTLSDIAIEFSAFGGKLLIIDEIHKAKDFALELKTIYDFVDIKVIFSGSSALELENSKIDLSRRALFYELGSLSFREFLAIKFELNLEALSLEEILNNHQSIALSIKEQFKPLEYFSYYKSYGAYPFFTEGELGYNLRLNEIMNIVLDSEVASIYNVDSDKINMIRRLLHLLCSSVPMELNIQNLAKSAEVSRNTLYSYLYYLKKANLIEIIGGNFRNKKLLNKPDKIYLDNINLYNILCSDHNIGSLRESFFVSQIKVNHSVKYSNIGDFEIDNQYIFELGGKNKSFKQIKDIENSFVIADDIEVGFGNKIPLWLFGFLY